jgi:hypothetical protein
MHGHLQSEADSHTLDVPMLDVVVRFHDPQRIFELRRAIFALVCQSYRPITIWVATQRFSESQIHQLRQNLSPTMRIGPRAELHVVNYTETTPLDARAALLNLGIQSGQGRYLAFLDHDDTILADGYYALIAELNSSRCAIAFGSIAMKDAEVFEDMVLVNARRATFEGHNLLDLFANNFCPIHSFVIDRSLVDTKDLWFDESLSKLEDYDFLLCFCAKYESSFHLIGKVVGDYYIKTDGSNTLSGAISDNPGWVEDWNRSVMIVERRKSERLLSDAVQKRVGGLTISEALERNGVRSLTGTQLR